jgi:VanZ family protein
MTVRVFQVCAWLVLGVIVALSLVAPSMRPVTILPHGLEHAAIFVIAGVAAALGYPNRPALTLAALVAFSGAVELAQLFAPGRHARLIDFVVDAAAACIGAVAAYLAMRLRASR